MSRRTTHRTAQDLGPRPKMRVAVVSFRGPRRRTRKEIVLTMPADYKTARANEGGVESYRASVRYLSPTQLGFETRVLLIYFYLNPNLTPDVRASVPAGRSSGESSFPRFRDENEEGNVRLIGVVALSARQ